MQQDSNPFYPSSDLRDDQRRFLDAAVISLGLPSLFYATLRDPRVFEAVVGRPMSTFDCERVTLRGFGLGVVNVGPGFPGVFPTAEPSQPALECVLVHGLGRFEQTMVAWYEWDEYQLRRAPLEDGRGSQVFVPNLEAIRREHGHFDIEPWSFETWQSRHVDRSVASARRWMAQRPADPALIEAGCFTPHESPMDGGRAAG